ncbi:hypothetical protein BUALT_Bualt03G0055100 [Buddleja alternifolia]|uniref:Dof zinc finger protein n=1 Tax=Buddleja alternifolia TaxID=168488 RepID=A0AAV6XST0_9LAMI|nr:hypothetical protein BUALT_Bualt03G0055100 [Buddleja alternifolia]
MLSNCSDKIMTPISSTTNEWPQNQILDDHKSFMASSSSSSANNNNNNNNNSKVVVVMEKTTNQQQDPPPHQPPLKCPRCDSSNTKFCYYNNYSLSQPRHFCKACKRYWTRGGTLRNVPVGGGCRKNKRVKRPQQPSNGGDGISSAAAATTNPNVQSQIDLTPTSNHINNPLFYSQLPTNPHELNFPFSSFRVSNDHHNNGGYDHHIQPPHMNGLGLGFSSLGLMGSEVQNMNDQYNKNGFKQIQDHVNSSSTTTNTSSVPLFSSARGNNSIFFGSSNFGSTSTMASLFASGIQHHKFQSPTHNYPGVMPYEEMQMGKQVKEEGENNRLEWNPNPNPNPNQNPNQIEQINGSDPSSLVWNTTNLGAWFDPSNIGSSVPSLI